jgi:hypothetical protein
MNERQTNALHRLAELSPMKIVIVKSMEEADKVVQEMRQKDLYLAAQSNAGLEEGWRLTFLPSSAFKKEGL